MNQTHESYNNALFKKYINIYDYIDSILNPLRKYISNRVNETDLNLIDVACGTGSLIKLIDNSGSKIVGIDISPDMLEVAKIKNNLRDNVSFQLMDTSDTKFRDGEFDLSIITFALHDMPLEMAFATLLEMKRITRIGGRIIVADYSDKSIFHFIPLLWESKYYPKFIKTGISKVLQETAMNITSRKSFLFGAVEVIEIRN